MGERIELFLVVLKFIADFAIAWTIVYLALGLIKTSSRSVQILKGVLMIYLLNIMANVLNMEILGVLTKDIITWGILAVIIIFQPEIRKGLEQLGRGKGLSRKTGGNTSINEIDEIVEAVESLSKTQTGALIVFEGKLALDEYSELATPIQSVVTSELIETIFFPNTPLHDGAMIIRKGDILCAGAILPSTTREDLSQTVGTRHRAAIGISEISDCLVVTVSEETGKISIAKDGEIQSFSKIFEFEKVFKEYMLPVQKNTSKGEKRTKKLSEVVE